MPLWLTYALLSALCAALISIFAKWGMSGVNPDIATAIRSVVQASFVVVFCIVLGLFRTLPTMAPKAWLAVVLSGVAGGLSWIFAFRALQLSTVSHVSPIDKLSMPLAIILAFILLKERPIPIHWAGIALIVVGAFLTTLRKST